MQAHQADVVLPRQAPLEGPVTDGSRWQSSGYEGTLASVPVPAMPYYTPPKYSTAPEGAVEEFVKGMMVRFWISVTRRYNAGNNNPALFTDAGHSYTVPKVIMARNAGFND